MANPLACAAANASLDIFDKKDVLIKVRKIESFFKTNLLPFKSYKFVKDIRVIGAVAVIEIYKLSFKRKKWLKKEFVYNGVWIRPFRNIIYFMPPFVITKKNLIITMNALKKVFSQWNKFDD